MSPRTGTVTEFDEHSGLGTVVDGGGTAFPFHCTQIADGTRTIPAGAPVEFDVIAAHGGRWEAAALRRTATSAGRAADSGS